MSIEITTLFHDQWQEYKAIRLEAVKNDPQAFGKSLEEESAYPDERWKDRLREVERGESYLFFARCENIMAMIIGAYFPKNKEGTAHVTAVFVKPEFRKQGIATKLLGHLLEVLKKDIRVSNVELAVSTDQKEAFQLYKKFGFEIIGTVRNKMGDGKEHEEYEMILNL